MWDFHDVMADLLYIWKVLQNMWTSFEIIKTFFYHFILCYFCIIHSIFYQKELKSFNISGD